GKLSTADETIEYIRARLAYLGTSRPTAVNLFDAIGKLNSVVVDRRRQQGDAGSAEDIINTYVDAAEGMLELDIADNRAIGEHGAKYLSQRNAAADEDKMCVLTHCNTGSLATAGYGTALGIVRSLFARGKLAHAYFTETRPYNQGSRLTAFELKADGIPSTLVCDSAASFLMNMQKIGAVVVGADRVATNGDTANKIGTYQLALAVRAHGVDFIVAAPTTSIDLGIASGNEIPVEQRDGREITHVSGILVGDDRVDNKRQAVQVAVDGIETWNPSFDVTPAEYITAIVTERGVVENKDFDKIKDILQG
ncbi:S-methyl-5-thioribose-1-phosphate isomerase, partial [Spiromyces aspiralis]